MTNKLRTLVATSAVGMSLAAVSAFGSDLTPLHVNVPFAFTAGKTVMPAGEYMVYENDCHLITIRGAKSAVMVLSSAGTEISDDKSTLEFERTSKGIELRSVHAAGRPSSQLPVFTGEK
jgi:hypothetical protein